MSAEWVFNLYVFVLATFVGYQVISRVPPLLHTPLMSGTNAISGISLVASLLAAGSQHRLSQILGFIAVTCASINVVGGFLITDRMLRMFRRKKPGVPEAHEASRTGRDRAAALDKRVP
jgi:NAD(P) transhydrogenase subunit alpha